MADATAIPEGSRRNDLPVLNASLCKKPTAGLRKNGVERVSTGQQNVGTRQEWLARTGKRAVSAPTSGSSVGLGTLYSPEAAAVLGDLWAFARVCTHELP